MFLRSIISLAIIPKEHIRRAMYLIIKTSPNICAPFLRYFCRTYIGLTQYDVDNPELAFIAPVEQTIENEPTPSFNLGLNQVSTFVQQRSNSHIYSITSRSETRLTITRRNLSMFIYIHRNNERIFFVKQMTCLALIPLKIRT